MNAGTIPAFAALLGSLTGAAAGAAGGSVWWLVLAMVTSVGIIGVPLSLGWLKVYRLLLDIPSSGPSGRDRGMAVLLIVAFVVGPVCVATLSVGLSLLLAREIVSL